MLVEDEYHFLLTCPKYKVNFNKYDDLLNGHDNFSVIFKSPLRRVSTYMGALMSYTSVCIETGSCRKTQNFGESAHQNKGEEGDLNNFRGGIQ